MTFFTNPWSMFGLDRSATNWQFYWSQILMAFVPDVINKFLWVVIDKMGLLEALTVITQSHLFFENYTS